MKKKKLSLKGAPLLLLVFVGLFLILFVRVVSIQATSQVNEKDLVEWANRERQQQTTIFADRGKILDNKGNAIAEDTLSYRLQAVLNPEMTIDKKKPMHVVDPEKTAKALAKHIDMPEKDIYKQLTQKGLSQVEFGKAGKGLTYKKMLAISEEELPGIIFARDLKRYYPNGVFASHVIGFTDIVINEDTGRAEFVGRMGLEQNYNKQLTGENGEIKYQKDKLNYILPNSKKAVTPAKNGNDIYLTLDKTIQNILDEALDPIFKEYTPEAMTAIVMRPKTGEILAMTQRPTFNPDTRENLDMGWLNASVEQTYEPGSTMKMFTLAASIDSGNWRPNDYYKTGHYKVVNNTIQDHNSGQGWGWDNGGQGYITFLEGFQRSSNTSMANLLEQMGSKTFYNYIDAFGFGKKTGIDLPNEATGKVLSENLFERYTTTFGQGTTVTSIQMMQAATAIANDGKMMQPYIIKKIVDSNTNTILEEHKPKEKGTPIKPETAQQVREVMATTITAKHGSGVDYGIEDYEVAGKTATAQVVNTDTGQYLPFGKNNYLYGFLGMAPKEDPELMMYIDIKLPHLKEDEYNASKPLSKVFTTVMQNSLKYLNVNPIDAAPVEKFTIPDYKGKDAYMVEVELENAGMQPIIIGEGGKIEDQYPKINQEIIRGNKVFIKTAGDSLLPSFIDWSLQNVLVYKALSGMAIEISGEGFVERQSISPRTLIKDNTPITLILQMPKDRYLPNPVEDKKSEPQRVEFKGLDSDELYKDTSGVEQQDGEQEQEDDASADEEKPPDIEPGGVG